MLMYVHTVCVYICDSFCVLIIIRFFVIISDNSCHVSLISINYQISKLQSVSVALHKRIEFISAQYPLFCDTQILYI